MECSCITNEGDAKEREIYSGGADCLLLKVNHVGGAVASVADKDAEEEEGEKQRGGGKAQRD